ncbi:MAG: hypothetical protein V1858_01675 [Candidatus Gottesmanbacteria bacterium]
MKKLLAILFFLTTCCLLLSAKTVYAVPPVDTSGTTTTNPSTMTGSVGSKLGVSGPWYVQNPDVWSQKVFGTTGGTAGGTNQNEMFKERYTLSILTDMMNAAIAAVGGTPQLIAQGPNGPIYARQGGAIQVMGNLTGVLYVTPPASSAEYLANVGQNLGVVKSVQAQGLGFSNLSPLLSLWKIFRDIAYLGFVVIFIIVGFMVMFRKKIDPRTVVTIQEALPRIVVALILVTFSYAIVGLMVDIMSFSINLVLYLLVKGLPNSAAKELMAKNIFDLFGAIGPKVIDFATKSLFNVNIGGWLGAAAGPLSFLSIVFVFGIGTFFIMFKIFFMLLGAYVGIILSVIFSPLQLILAAVPGSSSNVSSWLKGVLANILVFPVTFILILLVFIFLQAGGADFSQTSYLQPIIGRLPGIPKDTPLTWAPPLMNTGIASGVSYFIAFGILFTIPAVGEAIKHIFEIKPSPISGASEKEMKGGLRWVPFIGGTLGSSL